MHKRIFDDGDIEDPISNTALEAFMSDAFRYYPWNKRYKRFRVSEEFPKFQSAFETRDSATVQDFIKKHCAISPKPLTSNELVDLGITEMEAEWIGSNVILGLSEWAKSGYPQPH